MRHSDGAILVGGFQNGQSNSAYQEIVTRDDEVNLTIRFHSLASYTGIKNPFIKITQFLGAKYKLEFKILEGQR